VTRSLLVAVVALAALASFMACGATSGTPKPNEDDAAPPPSIPRPSTADPTVLRGYSAVLQRGCAGCHQSPDASDGILSGHTDAVPGTTAYASNLTPDPDTGLDGWTAAAIITAMRQGVDVDGQGLCTTMPRFADMKDDEAAAIASYLLFLTAVHHRIPEGACPPLKPHGTGDASDDAASDGSNDPGSDAGPSDAAVNALDAADG
jgi:mono/diheme cytochrome c family protein